MTETSYVELHAVSAFSFLAGASQPEALIERAAQIGMPAIALADRNGLYGAARFHTAARRLQVRAHIGAEIAVHGIGNRLTPPAWVPHQCPPEPPRLVLLCASRTGYQNLCQLITRMKTTSGAITAPSTRTEKWSTMAAHPALPKGRRCLAVWLSGRLADSPNC